MASYIYPISFKQGMMIINNEGELCSIQEVDFVPASAEKTEQGIEITSGYYDVLLENSKGDQQWWEYRASEYTCALLGETFEREALSVYKK